MIDRRGFTMITILWVMSVAGIIAMAATLSGRDTVNATRNRVYRERAFWIASGCASRVQFAIDSRLAQATSFEDAADAWRLLPRAIAVPPLAPECHIDLQAAGTRLDMNDASPEMIENLLRAMGFAELSVDLTDALLDWRDTDVVALPRGAERDWYAAANRELPRDGPLADIAELARVRGFENVALFDSVLSAESGRVSLATASATVLLSVPGFTRETADCLVALRDAGNPPADIMSVLPSLSRASVDAIVARYPEIVRVTTPNPDAWILTTRAIVGPPDNAVALSRRLVRSGKRGVVVRARSSL